MAQSKVEQTTRALEPALLPLPVVGRFTRYVRTGGYILFALWQSGKWQGDFQEGISQMTFGTFGHAKVYEA